MALKDKLIDLSDQVKSQDLLKKNNMQKKDSEYCFAAEMLERMKLAKERTDKCIHPRRVIQVYDHIYDEVMCLECGLIKLVAKGVGTHYTPKEKIPQIMEQSR